MSRILLILASCSLLAFGLERFVHSQPLPLNDSPAPRQLAAAQAIERDPAIESKQAQPGAPQAKAAKLDAPRHWSAQPDNLVEDLYVTHSWFVQFDISEERKVPARVFLIERRGEPRRIVCLGHEITADENFVPDYVVAKERVKPLNKGMYRVNLGSLEAIVQVVE